MGTSTPIDNAGSNYAVAPLITFVVGGDSGDSAVGVVGTCGTITGYTNFNGGSGYTSLQTVVITSSGRKMAEYNF